MHALVEIVSIIILLSGYMYFVLSICRVSSWSAQSEDSEAKDAIIGATKSMLGPAWFLFLNSQKKERKEGKMKHKYFLNAVYVLQKLFLRIILEKKLFLK